MTAMKRISWLALLVWILLAQGLPVYAYNILAIGDSITAGYPTEYSYRDSLYNQLSSHNYQFDFIGPYKRGEFSENQNQHGAVVGATINSLENEVKSWAGTYVSRADVVLVHIGINDLRAWWEMPDPAVKYNQLTNLLTTIVSYNPNVDILLAQIIKTGVYYDATGRHGEHYDMQTWGKVEAYNGLIASNINAWASNQGSSWEGIIKFVNMENKLDYFDYHEVNVGDFADELHPSIAGYDKMGLAWYSALQDSAFLGMPPTPVPLPIPAVLLASGIVGLAAIRRRLNNP